jgi:hypothetical protein
MPVAWQCFGSYAQGVGAVLTRFPEALLRKSISESQAQLLSALIALSPSERDALARRMLAATRRTGDNRFEDVAIAVDSLCFSIDGTTKL